MLSTYENAGTGIEFTSNLSYTKAISKIKSMIEVNPSFSYYRSPSYVQAGRNITDLYMPGLKLGIRFDLTSNLRLNFNTKTSFTHTVNTHANDVDALIHTSWLEARYFFSKRWYASTVYRLNVYHNFDYKESRLTTNRWNAAVGRRMFRNGSGDLSLAVFDILNSGQTLQTLVWAEYVRSTWRYNYGRYITLNFSYRFNSKKQPTLLTTRSSGYSGSLLSVP